MKELRSERLWLRPPSSNDAAFVARLMNSEGYLQNIGDRGVRNAEDAKAYLASAPIYRTENGLGFNIVELSSDDEPIGICGLVKRDGYGHPDVGYAFLDEYSGRGFASEATRRAVKHAFQDLGLPELLAITSQANIGSRKVLEKLGFALSRPVEDDVCLYRLLACDSEGTSD